MLPYYTFSSSGTNVPKPGAAPGLSEVGGKGLSLIELSAASFPVPPGFVLSVSFFEPWMRDVLLSSAWNAYLAAGELAEKSHCDRIQEYCRTLRPTSSQRDQLDAAVREAFGDGGLGLVAVRSSSPSEDLADSSFAGGYDTTLGVNAAGLDAAVVACFVSLFDFRAAEYARRRGKATDVPRMAAVVQRMLDGEVAGVAFSLNPTNNCYDEAVVSANFGLGESVVGGTVASDVYTVDRVRNAVVKTQIGDKREAIFLNPENEGGGTRSVPNEDPAAPALSDARVLEVAKLVGKVETFRGGQPTDIEWAYENSQLFLLQARPITAYFPLCPEMTTEPGEEKRLYLDVILMTQGFSEPFSVLGLDVWKTFLKKMKPAQFQTEGTEGLAWNIHGRQYMNISNTCKATCGRKMVEMMGKYDASLERAFKSINLDDYVPSYTPSGVKGVFWSQIKQCVEILPSFFKAMWTKGSNISDYTEAAHKIIDLCQDQDYMKDAPFEDVLNTMSNKIATTVPLLGCLMYTLLCKYRLDKLFDQCEGAKDHIVSMCMDLDGNPTSEMGHRMVRLASFPEFRTTPSPAAFLENLRTKSYSDEFAAAYADFMKYYGCRGMREIDIATPRTHEKVSDFFEHLRHIDIDDNAVLRVAARRKEAYETLSRLAGDVGKQKDFAYYADMVKRTLGYREHPKYLIVVVVDFLRRRVRRLGEEWAHQGRIPQAEDVFDLTAEQISEAQRDTTRGPIRTTQHLHRPSTTVYPGQLPLLIDSRGRILRGERDNTELGEGVLAGDPISPGTVTGRARVLREPYEKKLARGEVLVARFTEPSWTPIFINAAAVVMEVGGPLQHGAVIAREYGIPCVSGIVDAVTIIKDGDLLEVNGSDGTVRIIQDK